LNIIAHNYKKNISPFSQITFSRLTLLYTK
jgi:hypothetical protein